MRLLNKFTIIGAFLTTSMTSFADDKASLSVSASEVAAGIYMLEGVGGFVGGNMALSIGDDGVVMIDDGMSPHLDIIKTAIKSVTDKPIDFLINTHIHGDHIGNNETLGKQGIRIVGHENIHRSLIKNGMPRSGNKPVPKAALPVITFSHAMNFHLNGYNMHIFHAANAHTDGDAVIHFKEINVIHAGDTMFNGLFPYIDFGRGGSLDGYIAAQKKILSLADGKTKIIPGHGPLANREDLERAVAMLEDSKKLITELISLGRSEEEVVKLNPLSRYHDKWSWNFITTKKMTRQVYQGLKLKN